MWIACLGNVKDGYRFFGPFKTEQKAWDWDHSDDCYPNITSAETPDFQVIKLEKA